MLMFGGEVGTSAQKWLPSGACAPCCYPFGLSQELAVTAQVQPLAKSRLCRVLCLRVGAGRRHKQRLPC